MNLEKINENDIFNLDIDNYYIYDCELSNNNLSCKSYIELLKYLMNYICDKKGMNELVDQSNYPSYFECELDNDINNCNQFLFDFTKLNNRQMLNEIFELQKLNNYSLSFGLGSKLNSKYFYIVLLNTL